MAVGSRLFFTAETPGTGREAYTWTAADGARFLGDLAPGSDHQPGGMLAAVGGKVLIYTQEGSGASARLGLWASDGVDTVHLGWFDRLNPGYEVSGRHILFARRGSEQLLFATDGTPEGSEQIHTSHWLMGNAGEFSGPLVEAGKMYFGSWASLEEQAYLWATDGTVEGTVQQGFLGNARGQMGILNGQLLYVHVDQSRASGDELRSIGLDGSGPQILWGGDAPYGEIYGFNVTRDRVFFEGQTVDSGYELHVSDGTATGTTTIDINPGALGSNPSSFRAFRDGVVFTASIADTGRELWYSDGSEAGTVLLADAQPGTLSGSALVLGIRNELLFYTADNSEYGLELWVTDGSPSGTRLLYDLAPGPISSYPQAGVVLDDRLLMGAYMPDSGRELYSVNLESGEMLLEADLNGGTTSSSSPSDFASNGGLAAFTANDGLSGTQVWLSDGTVEGSNPVPGSSANLGPSSEPKFVENVLYWQSSRAVWRHDLASGITSSVGRSRVDELLVSTEILVVQSGPQVELLDPETLERVEAFEGARVAIDEEGRVFAVANDRVVTWTREEGLRDAGAIPTAGWVRRDGVAAWSHYYFLANESAGPTWLWASDGENVVRVGTEPVSCCTLRPIPVQGGMLLGQYDRTLLVKGTTIEVLVDQRGFSEFVRLGTLTYFVSEGGDGSAALRVTDGTVDGTRLLQRLPASGHEVTIVGAWNGSVVLAIRGDDRRHQVYLASDARLQPVGQRYPSYTAKAAVVGDRLIFRAEDQLTGSELWVLDLANTVSSEAGASPGDSAIEVWPNPTADRVQVSTPVGTRIEAFDMLGQRVGSWVALASREPLEIQVASWPVGTYALRITDAEATVVRLLTVVR